MDFVCKELATCIGFPSGSFSGNSIKHFFQPLKKDRHTASHVPAVAVTGAAAVTAAVVITIRIGDCEIYFSRYFLSWAHLSRKQTNFNRIRRRKFVIIFVCATKAATFRLASLSVSLLTSLPSSPSHANSHPFFGDFCVYIFLLWLLLLCRGCGNAAAARG